MMRQISKQILSLPGFLRKFLRLSLVVFAVLVFGGTLQASTSRLGSDVVTDPLSGLALNGYDAVSYFTDVEPMPGQMIYEVLWNGVSWLFSSEANMKVFLSAPEVYAPQFGGHGVMSLSRGFLSDGNPLIYTVLDNRLYLFYSFPNRDAFGLSDKTSRVGAIQNWEKLRIHKN